MIYLWFLGFLSSPGCAAPVSENFTVSAKPHVSVQRGHTAILPCWLTFSESAEDMEVRWDHWNDDYDPPVLLYQAGAFDFSSQKASYAGRVSLGLKEETSGGLKAGDVSLKLEKATIEDAGKYTCFVSSSDDYDSATISLSVTETGHQPLLSAVMKDHNKVNVSCQSDGWHPEPELSWSDSKTALTPANVMFSKNSTGFYSVHSWVLVSSPSEVSCSVGLFNEEPKTISAPYLETKMPCAGWVAFEMLLVLLVAFGALYFLYFRKKGKCLILARLTSPNLEISQLVVNKTQQTQDVIVFLLKGPSCAELMSISKGKKEDIIHSYFFLCVSQSTEFIYIVPIHSMSSEGTSQKKPIHADIPTDQHGSQRLYQKHPSIMVSSGRHYWEVSLANAKFHLIKKSWWIGVTDKHKIPHDESFPPTTKNGFWFLSSCPNQEDTVQFSTEPETFIYVQSKPKTVGVYLDFDNRELSFYNVEEKCLIGSLAAKFTGELFPLFNPGKGDPESMTIVQKPVQNQSKNTENTVEKVKKTRKNGVAPVRHG
uniref:Ig-like domain-containing protein n=1 Tax=Poecilia formosa TaxID=48698 RepID=A0A087XML3_POEFO